MPVLPLETSSPQSVSIDDAAERARTHSKKINQRAEFRRSVKPTVIQAPVVSPTVRKTGKTISDINRYRNLSVAEIAEHASQTQESPKTETTAYTQQASNQFDLAPKISEAKADIVEPENSIADSISAELQMISADPYSGTLSMSPSFGVIRKPFFGYRDRSKLVKPLIWIAISIAILAGAYGIWASIQAAKTVEETIGSSGGNAAVVSDEPNADLDENKPDIDGYKVAPDMPRTISIPKIGAYGRVLALATVENNKLAAPDNIYDAGWYDGSVKPGAGAGAAVIDGHKSGLTQPGIFMNLGTLTKGDEIAVERGDGKAIKYSVHSKETVPYTKVDMLKALTPVQSGKESLTLITCSGEWDRNAGTSLNRDIVYAVRIN